MSSAVRTRSELQHQLSSLYPHPIPAGQLSKLYNRWARMCARPVCYPTLEEEVYCLLDTIKWEKLPQRGELATLLDPCAGTGCLLAELWARLQHLRLRFIGNDLHPAFDATYHLDATLPSSWEVMPRPDAIVSSPPYELLDILFPEFIWRARVVAMLHVPGDYISNGPQHRRMLWAHLEREGLTATIEGLPRVAGRPMRRCAWLIIFKSAQLKERLWRPRTHRVVLTQAE
jgi:hypothetical protein